MGARFRLKAGYDIGRFRLDTQVVLRAMQRHGVILADNGSNWYFTGTAEHGWDTDMLDELKSVPAGAFEAIDASSLMVDPNSGLVRGGPPGAPAPPTTARPRAARAPTAAPVPPATTTTPPPPSTTSTTSTTLLGVAAAPDRVAAKDSGGAEGGPAAWPRTAGLAVWLAVGGATAWRVRRGRAAAR
jgi:hypothetical protein